MQLALSTPSVPPPVPVWAELSENLRQGFTTQNQPWNLGPNVVNSTSAIGFGASLLLNGVRQSDRARYYNPAIGRFIGEDPIGLAAGPNEYAYVDDSPLSFIDPLGMDKKDNCHSKANRWLLIHGGLDALSGIPGVGLYAAGAQIVTGAAITDWNGTSTAAQTGQGTSMVAGAAGFANMLEDNIPGMISRGLPRFAEALPGIGAAAAAISVGLDLYEYNQKLQECGE